MIIKDNFNLSYDLTLRKTPPPAPPLKGVGVFPLLPLPSQGRGLGG